MFIFLFGKYKVTKYYSETVLNLSPEAYTKTDTSRREKLFVEIQNSFFILQITEFP